MKGAKGVEEEPKRTLGGSYLVNGVLGTESEAKILG